MINILLFKYQIIIARKINFIFIWREQEITSTLRDFVPLKKGLKLIEFSEQRLTRFTSRILVTMARITDKSSGTNYGDEITKDLTINSLNRFRENYFSSNKN